MGKPLLKVLDEAEAEAIYHTALALLANVGVAVQDRDALAFMARGGAQVDEASGRVRLPPKLVEDALAVAPKQFCLCDRRGGILPLPAGKHYHFSGCETLRVLEYATGNYRLPTLDDAIRFARLADALPLIAGVTPQVCNIEGEGTVEAKELRVLQAMVCNTTKHCLIAPSTLAKAETWLDIGQILAGSEPLADRPVISLVASPSSPLQWDGEILACLSLAARRGVPLIVLPSPLAGMSAPVTLAGTLALNNAEMLFALVAAQLAKPEAPFIMGGLVLSIMDMRTGNLVLAGPESVLGVAAQAQMAHFFQLPSYSCAAHADGKRPDEQVGMEKMAGMLATIAAGADISINAGSLNKTVGSSYEQMVIDHEMLRYLYRCLTGIAVDEETLAYPVIEAVGPGGSFLTTDHTQRFLRSGENVYLRLFDRTHSNDEVQDLITRAHEEVEAVLYGYEPSVAEETQRQIAGYVDERLQTR